MAHLSSWSAVPLAGVAVAWLSSTACMAAEPKVPDVTSFLFQGEDSRDSKWSLTLNDDGKVTAAGPFETLLPNQAQVCLPFGTTFLLVDAQRATDLRKAAAAAYAEVLQARKSEEEFNRRNPRFWLTADRARRIFLGNLQLNHDKKLAFSLEDEQRERKSAVAQLGALLIDTASRLAHQPTSGVHLRATAEGTALTVTLRAVGPGTTQVALTAAAQDNFRIIGPGMDGATVAWAVPPQERRFALQDGQTRELRLVLSRPVDGPFDVRFLGEVVDGVAVRACAVVAAHRP